MTSNFIGNYTVKTVSRSSTDLNILCRVFVDPGCTIKDIFDIRLDSVMFLLHRFQLVLLRNLWSESLLQIIKDELVGKLEEVVSPIVHALLCLSGGWSVSQNA